jgi:hypothetical protein
MATIIERYSFHSDEIEKNLNQLKKKLKKHQSDFKREQTNWGYVGDLTYINERLAELNSFIKD